MYITFIINLNILNYVIQNKTLVVLVCSFLVIIIVSVFPNVGSLLAQIKPFGNRKTTTIMQNDSLLENIKDKRENVASNIVFVANSTMENKNQGQENIIVKKGQEFTVTLESNPGTGYQWIPMFNTSIINLISHNFQPSTTKLMGSPGTDVFKFKAINFGTESLKMVYKRSWEKEFVKEKVFVISVT